MWDPITLVPRTEYYIYSHFGHYYVRNGKHQDASNWKALEYEAANSVIAHSGGGDGYSPCTHELAAKARFDGGLGE